MAKVKKGETYEVTSPRHGRFTMLVDAIEGDPHPSVPGEKLNADTASGLVVKGEAMLAGSILAARGERVTIHLPTCELKKLAAPKRKDEGGRSG